MPSAVHHRFHTLGTEQFGVALLLIFIEVFFKKMENNMKLCGLF
jgi:hypothetical protein